MDSVYSMSEAKSVRAFLLCDLRLLTLQLEKFTGLSCLCSALKFLISCLISCQTRLVSTVSSPLSVPHPSFSSLLLHQFPLSVGGDLTSPLKDWLIFTYIEFHCDMLSIYFKHQCISFLFFPNKTKLPLWVDPCSAITAPLLTHIIIAQ